MTYLLYSNLFSGQKLLTKKLRSLSQESGDRPLMHTKKISIRNFALCNPCQARETLDGVFFDEEVYEYLKSQQIADMRKFKFFVQCVKS